MGLWHFGQDSVSPRGSSYLAQRFTLKFVLDSSAVGILRIAHAVSCNEAKRPFHLPPNCAATKRAEAITTMDPLIPKVIQNNSVAPFQSWNVRRQSVLTFR